RGAARDARRSAGRWRRAAGGRGHVGGRGGALGPGRPGRGRHGQSGRGRRRRDGGDSRGHCRDDRRSGRLLERAGRGRGPARARVETILGRQAPERLRRLFHDTGVFAHLAASDEPLFIPEDAEHGLTGRMVAAVRAGRELVGSVWVTAAAPLDGPRRQALLDAARTVALHLLRSRVSADLERQIESDLVTQLLVGTADAATIMSRLGLPPGPTRVIAVRPRGERQAALLLTFERATTGFGWSRPGRSALDGTTVYTLLPGEPAAAARRWTEALAAALPPSLVLAAGISAAATMTELP